jgi:hypothetical protein
MWCNNGSWWVFYVLHFSGKKRRIRRSLGTSCVEEAIRRRDVLFAHIEQHGEEVPERGTKKRRNEESEDEMSTARSISIRHVPACVAIV